MIESLDKNWCLEEYTGPSPNKFMYTNMNGQYAVDQILITGHYLYALNPDFRQLYINTFGTEMTLVGKDEVDFLYKNNFNLLYFGLLAAPYLISKGATPTSYLERCSAENSAELAKFIAEESSRIHKPLSAKPGMPFYYYRVQKTKFFQNSLTKQMEFICPAKAMLTKAIGYAESLQKDAQLAANELLEKEELNASRLMDVLRDESWSPFLYGK